MQPDVPVETALRVYRRYLKLEPSHTEEYIAYLKSKVSINLVPEREPHADCKSKVNVDPIASAPDTLGSTSPT